MDILYLFAWWLGIAYLGGVTFVLIRPHVSQFFDQGYGLAKAIGLILFSFILWLLASLSILPFSGFSAMLIAAALGLLAARQVLSGKLGKIPWRAIATQEAIFAISLAAWSVFRSYNPKIEGVEKFMDIAVLNSLLRSDYFPPVDPWFANEPLNYYYFGHLLIASLAKLVHVPAEVAFNLGIPLVFALCVCLIAGLVYSLTKSKVAAGVAAFLLTLSSNLDPAINSIRQVKDYIFFGATRLDPYTINEFPLYSFVVADLHAHTLGLPIALAIICLLYVVIKAEKVGWPIELLLAILIGAAGPTNSFDLVIYGGLTGLAFMLRAYIRYGAQPRPILLAAAHALGIGILAGLLYLPFYLNFRAPVGGVGVAIFQTPLWFLLVNFGILLFLGLPLLLARIRQLSLNRTLQALTAEDNFIWLLLGFGLLLVLATEFIYLKDIYTYQNPPYARANTIFKVYYQVWVLLAVVAGYGLAKAKTLKIRWRLLDVYILGVGALLALSLVGTWSAIEAYRDNKSSSEPSWTLDGYTYLTVFKPDQLALVNWLNEHVDGQPTILEAAGESYTQKSIISSYTGLPTVLGWASHEWGWRYTQTAWADTISPRMGEIQQAYTTSDSGELQSILNKYAIEYVVVSPVEMEVYQIDDFPLLEDLMGPPIFSQGEYKLYRTP